MSHRYFPHTDEDIAAMLTTCGVESLRDLYSDVPDSLLFNRDYNLPEEKSEAEVRGFFDSLLEKNVSYETNLAGGGFYSHHVPSVIPSIIARSEFLTAYTPYQPEISQGTLQYIFEYQTLMARLTGLEISNASLYDGATAAAEAVMLAVSNARKKNRVLVSEGLAPQVRKVIETYCHYKGITLTYIPLSEQGTTSREDLTKELSAGDVAGVLVASPNYYGILEDFTGWADECHGNKALFMMSNIAADLVSVKSPGEWGADIAVGDAQSLGIPLNSGGPYLGYICSSKSLMRKIPGRIVGMTKDSCGRRSFVLTLQAREQHIRREKATSNICSNQGLMALYVTVYMSLLGLKGIRQINRISYDGAHWLASQLCDTGKVSLTYPDSEFFNEFCISFNTEKDRESFFDKAAQNRILAGVKVGTNRLLIAVTETADKTKLEQLIEILKSL